MSSGPHASDDRRPAHSAATAAPLDFGALFTASYRAIWLVAYGVVQDAALAEDVVQEAALVALGKIREFRPGTNFTAWIGKIVHYVAMNQARARRRRRTFSLETAESSPAPATTATNDLRALVGGDLAAHQTHFDDRVMAALKQVPRTPRTCLLLRTVEGLDYAEIARLLRIPEGTAMSHVHRTRLFLRQELADLRPTAAVEGSATR